MRRHAALAAAPTIDQRLGGSLDQRKRRSRSTQQDGRVKMNSSKTFEIPSNRASAR
jgi:hypothetical protein